MSKVSFFSIGSTPQEVPPQGYAYKCEDTSYLKPLFYKLFVMPLANRVPAKVAPNDITFLSQLFAFIPAAFALAIAFASQSIAPWWYLVIPGIGFLGYIILDHLDGTHARRTGQSSPLGELTDHWCDAWNGALVPFAWSICWGGMQYPMVTTLLAITGALAYTFAVSEHKATGVMKLDKIGGNEGMILMTLSMVPFCIFGQRTVLDQPLPFLYEHGGYTVQHLLQFLHVIGCLGTVKNVVLRTGVRAIADTLPIIVASGIILWWVHTGLDVRFAAFMLAALTAIVAGRMVLARTHGLSYKWDGLGLAALLVGLAVESTHPDKNTQIVTASCVLFVLVLRACADFAWGARHSTRWIKATETLGMFFEPHAVEVVVDEPQTVKKV
ncbi:MAG: CDP-alcohol phosphatidyltransferase family protein [Planctomycetota bacterium]